MTYFISSSTRRTAVIFITAPVRREMLHHSGYRSLSKTQKHHQPPRYTKTADLLIVQALRSLLSDVPLLATQNIFSAKAGTLALSAIAITTAVPQFVTINTSVDLLLELSKRAVLLQEVILLFNTYVFAPTRYDFSMKKEVGTRRDNVSHIFFKYRLLFGSKRRSSAAPVS